MAVHSTHRAPYPLVPGTLSAAVTPLHQGGRYAVRHRTAGGQQEVWTNAQFRVALFFPAALFQAQMLCNINIPGTISRDKYDNKI